MKDKDIDRIIDRFATGDISEEEQRQLISHFSDGDRSDIPEELEGRLSDTIDRLAGSERLRSEFRVGPTPRTTAASRSKSPRHSRIRLMLSAAASLAVLLSLGLHFLIAPSHPVHPTPEDTYSTPEDAYPDVEKALLIFTSTLDKGMRQIELVETTTTDITTKVTSQINKSILNDNPKI